MNSSMHKDREEATRSGKDLNNPHLANRPGITPTSDTLKFLQLQSNQTIPTKFITSPSTLIAPSVDGNYFFVANESSIEIFNHSNLIHTINNAHKSKITALQTLHYDPHKLISAGLDGVVILWDILESTPIKHITYHSPITHLLVLQSASDRRQSTLFITLNKLAARPKMNDGSDRPPVINSIYYKLVWSHSDSIKKKSILFGQSRPASTVNIDDNLLIAQCGKKLNVSHHNKEDKAAKAFVKFVSSEKHNISSIDPLKQFIVTTESSSGKIHLWPYNKLNDHLPLKAQTNPDWHGGHQNHCPTEVLHWHSNSVNALTFTPEGSFLLSGGDEGVLVRWHIRSNSGRLMKKDFLPRLGSAIVSITCYDESKWVVGLADSTKLFIDGAQWRVDHAVRGVLVPSISNKDKGVPMAVTSSNKLIMPSSHPAVLQIYDTTTNTSEELEVSPTNRIQSRFIQNDTSQGRVEEVVVSNGWLATLENAAVKVWQLDESGKYQLNTRIDKPHGAHAVTNIAWSNSASQPPTLATVGNDRKCRLWRAEPLEYRPKALGKIKSIVREGQVSFSLFATINYKDEAVKQVLFSPDSTLLVLVHDSFLTLWNPTAVYAGRNGPTILKVLSGEGLTLDEAVFVGGSHIAVRATAGKRNASHGVCLVYDFTSCECVYTHSFVYTTPQILAHSSEKMFAVISGATRPRIHTSDDQAVAERERVLSKSAVCTQMTLFAVRDGQVSKENVVEFDNTYFKYVFWPLSAGFNMVGLATTHDAATRGDTDRDTTHLGSRGAVLIGNEAAAVDLRKGDDTRSTAGNMFEEIFGRFDDHLTKAAGLDDRVDGFVNTASSTSALRHLFDGPAHLLPGPQIMYSDFLHGFLPKRAGTAAEGESSTSVLWDARQAGSGVAMDVDELAHTQPESNRQIGVSEVKAMTDLFKDII